MDVHEIVYGHRAVPIFVYHHAPAGGPRYCAAVRPGVLHHVRLLPVEGLAKYRAYKRPVMSRVSH